MIEPLGIEREVSLKVEVAYYCTVSVSPDANHPNYPAKACSVSALTGSEAARADKRRVSDTTQSSSGLDASHAAAAPVMSCLDGLSVTRLSVTSLDIQITNPGLGHEQLPATSYNF